MLSRGDGDALCTYRCSWGIQNKDTGGYGAGLLLYGKKWMFKIFVDRFSIFVF